MCEEVAKDTQLLRNIFFREESTFFLNADINTQNMRFWCDLIPFIFRYSKIQRIQKINLFAGILGENIIGPLFYTEHLSGDVYLDMLQGPTDSLITRVTENSVGIPVEQLTSEDKGIFQHDSGPAYLKKSVRG